MQIKEYFKGLAYAAFQPAIKSLSNGFPAWGAGFSMLSNNQFSFDIRGINAYNNKIFYAAQNILVRKLTEAPITFSKKKSGAKKFDKFYSKSISNEQRAHIKSQALTEVEDHELNVLFDAPNAYQSGNELREDFWYNYAFGDGFFWFERLGSELSRSSKPIAVHSLSRDRVSIVESNDNFNRVKGYIYTTWNGNQIPLQKEDVLHLKHWNPNIGDLKGLGVDIIASADMSINNANNTAQGVLFENNGRGTLISSKVDLNQEGAAVGKMTKEQMLALKETVMQDMTGARNNGRIKFTNGEIVVTPYGDTFADMNLINAENANWKSIFAIVGIPVALAPITEAATENNVKAGYKALVTNLVVSELRKFDQKLNQKIQQWWPDIIACHDLTEFTELAPDLELMMKVYGSPSLSEDERRAIFGYDEMENGLGSVYLVPSGLMKLEDLVSNEFDNVPDAKEL